MTGEVLKLNVAESSISCRRAKQAEPPHNLCETTLLHAASIPDAYLGGL